MSRKDRRMWLTEPVLLAEIRNNPQSDYTPRIKSESAGYLYGESVGWDKEKMLQYFLHGISGWLGREEFERSYDNGSMKHYAMVYHNVGMVLGIIK